jgi:hypothetical protein
MAGSLVTRNNKGSAKMKSISTAILLSWLLIASFGTLNAETINLLILGNSYCGRTNLNATIKGLINAGPDSSRVNVGLSDKVILEGANLDAHWRNQASLAAIDSRKYTHVILQGYIHDFVYIVGMPTVVQEADTATKYAGLLATRAKGVGAIPIIMSPQAPRLSTAQDWHFVESTYVYIAQANSALFAPCGVAWQHTIAETSQVHISLTGLWSGDAEHQGVTGNYINACVYYSMFVGKSPAGIEYFDFPGYVPDPEWRFVQRPAWETVDSMNLANQTRVKQYLQVAGRSGAFLPPIVPKRTIQLNGSVFGQNGFGARKRTAVVIERDGSSNKIRAR